jgi:hypothetical protein
MIDQDAAHHRRCQAEEVRPIAPIDLLLPKKSQIGLVHESGSLERVTCAFVAELRRCDPLELDVGALQEILSGLRVASAPSSQQARDLERRVIVAGHGVEDRARNCLSPQAPAGVMGNAHGCTGPRFLSTHFDDGFACYRLGVAEFGVEGTADRARLRGGVPLESLFLVPDSACER